MNFNLRWVEIYVQRVFQKPSKIDWSDAPKASDPHPSCYVHEPWMSLQKVRALYEESGFDASVVLESHKHTAPTTAKAVGFPWNWRMFPDLCRWGPTVLRLHVEVYRLLLHPLTYISIPHVEPDPAWDPVAHIKMVRENSALLGLPAVKILKESITSIER